MALCEDKFLSLSLKKGKSRYQRSGYRNRDHDRKPNSIRLPELWPGITTTIATTKNVLLNFLLFTVNCKLLVLS